jgi:hypothetical protein
MGPRIWGQNFGTPGKRKPDRRIVKDRWRPQGLNSSGEENGTGILILDFRPLIPVPAQMVNPDRIFLRCLTATERS